MGKVILASTPAGVAFTTTTNIVDGYTTDFDGTVTPEHYGYGPTVSLGGRVKPNKLKTIAPPWSPWFRKYQDATAIHQLFRPVSATERAAGLTLHRILALPYAGNGTPVENLRLTCSYGGELATVQIAEGVVGSATGTETSTVTATWASSFYTSNTSYSETSDTIIIMFKYVVAAGALYPAGRNVFPYPFFKITITSSNYETANYYFYNHYIKGVSVSSFTNNFETANRTIAVGDLVTYSVLVKNNSTGALDSHIVGYNYPVPILTTANIDSEYLQYDDYEYMGVHGSMTTLNYAHYLSLGTYRYDWTPAFPGVYTHTAHIGEHSLTRVDHVVPFRRKD